MRTLSLRNFCKSFAPIQDLKNRIALSLCFHFLWMLDKSNKNIKRLTGIKLVHEVCYLMIHVKQAKNI